MSTACDKLVRMAKKTSATSSVIKVLVIVLLALLVIGIVAEILLRVFISSQVRSGFEQQAQEEGVEAAEEPEVSFGAVPLLFGLAGGSINQVTIDTPSTLQINGDDISGQPSSSVTLNGLGLDESMTADKLTATTEVPEDFLLATMRQEITQNYPEGAGPLAEHLTITDLTANEAENSLDAEFVHGAAVLTLTPVERDGQLAFEASNTRLFGFELPQEVTEQISDALSQGLTEQATTGGMEIQGFEILDGAVRITITGENVPLREVSESTNPSASEDEQSQAA